MTVNKLKNEQWHPIRSYGGAISGYLPKEDGRYLITNSEGIAFAMFRDGNFGQFVIAWRELPKPFQGSPQGGGEDL